MKSNMKSNICHFRKTKLKKIQEKMLLERAWPQNKACATSSTAAGASGLECIWCYTSCAKISVYFILNRFSG